MSAFTHSVLITGGTVGLGYHCALSIARQHPEFQVVIASRTDPHSAAASINTVLGQNNVTYTRLDLSDMTNIRTFASEWETRKFPPVRALVLNAGLQFPGDVQYTVDGIEATFGINHVGHALLFFLLRPHLADSARVILTTSGTHDPAMKTGLPDAKYTSAEELAHPTPETARNKGRQRYATSKLANVMWGYALHRRFARVQGKSWTVVSVDPGLMPGTGLAREASSLERMLWFHLMPHILPFLRLLLGSDNIKTPQVSGAALAWLAVGADVEGSSEKYYEGRKIRQSSEESYDEKKQEDLWQWTVTNTAINQKEADRFGNFD